MPTSSNTKVNKSDGKASGGTGQALRIAKAYSVNIYNLYNETDRESLRSLLKLIKKNFLNKQ